MRFLRSISTLCVLVMVSVSAGYSQQVYQFSQYLQNIYALNTATAGLHDYTEVNVGFRKQWVGIDNSPQTLYLSVNTPLGKRLELSPKASSVRISNPQAYNDFKRKSFHAVGGMLAVDSYGPYAQTVAMLSYAFHLPVAEELTLSFSPNVSFNSVRFDRTKAIVELQGDPTYDSYVGMQGKSQQMDINLAFWMYHTKFFFGYSSDQLVQDRLQVSSTITLEDLKAHHQFIGGYHHKMKRNIVLTPSVMVKYVDQSPLSFDVNFRVDYQDRIWGGLSYRNAHALVAMFGMHVSNTFRFGYAFDFSLSAIRTQNIGSHELLIGVNLFNREKAAF